jgi:hypothetical protein
MGKTYRSQKSFDYDDYNAPYKTNKNKKREIKKFLENKKNDKKHEIDENGDYIDVDNYWDDER